MEAMIIKIAGLYKRAFASSEDEEARIYHVFMVTAHKSLHRAHQRSHNGETNHIAVTVSILLRAIMIAIS